MPPATHLGDAQVFNGCFSQYTGSSHTNAVSGELELTCLAAGDQSPNRMTFVGHDDGAWFGDGKAKGRAARTWLVTTGDAGKTHRFAFAGVNAGADASYRLVHRAVDGDAWRVVAKADGEPVFDVADVAAGCYTLEIAAPGVCIIVR